MGEVLSPKDYRAMNTNEARADAVASAETVEALDAMWSAWEERGMSTEGLTHASVLSRKAELGYDLSDDEEELIERMAAKQKENSKLPPITGEFNL